VRFLTREGCHLCDEARPVLHDRVLAEGVIDDRKLLKDALQREVDL
jgi:hypothetical protein